MSSNAYVGLRAGLVGFGLVLAATAVLEPAGAEFASVDLSGAACCQDFKLTDHHGVQRSLSDYRGRVVVLTFGFTGCPDVCPTTLLELSNARQLLGADAAGVQVLFVTLDPEQDDGKRLSAYLASFDPSFIGLSGPPEAVATTTKTFRVFYQKRQENGPTYTIDHTTGSYVIDRHGKIRLFVSMTQTPANVAADLRLLLAD